MAEEKQMPQVSVTTDELVPYIVKQGEALMEQVYEARKKYGDRYNDRNSIEVMYHKMGNPMYEHVAKQYADEFMLILQKKSTLPATVRYPVRDICQQAMNECYHDKLVALWKKQEAERKAKEQEGEKPE